MAAYLDPIADQQRNNITRSLMNIAQPPPQTPLPQMAMPQMAPQGMPPQMPLPQGMPPQPMQAAGAQPMPPMQMATGSPRGY